MRGHWLGYIVAFLIGVVVANRVGLLAPLAGNR